MVKLADIEACRHMSNNIRQLREEAGINQEELADEMGVTRMTVYRWENGKSKPDKSRWPDLADLLGVSVGDLEFESSGDGSRGKPKDAVVRTESELSLWRNYLIRVDRVLPENAPDHANETWRWALVSLPMAPFWDEGSAVASFDLQELADHANLDESVLRDWVDEVMASPWVERVGRSKWTVKLTMAEEAEGG